MSLLIGFQTYVSFTASLWATMTAINDVSFQIAVNPFKYNALISFLRILGAPKDILQQFINIMTLELVSLHFK